MTRRASESSFSEENDIADIKQRYQAVHGRTKQGLKMTHKALADLSKAFCRA